MIFKHCDLSKGSKTTLFIPFFIGQPLEHVLSDANKSFVMLGHCMLLPRRQGENLRAFAPKQLFSVYNAQLYVIANHTI